MKTIGIVAHSAEGGALCFLTACREGAAQLGPHMHPQIVVSAIPMGRSMPGWESGDRAAVAAHLTQGVQQVADAGAEFFICPDNTGHLVLEAIAPTLALPGLHIAEVVCHEIASHGWKRVGLLGTKWTMNGSVYARALEARGFERLIPDADHADVRRRHRRVAGARRRVCHPGLHRDSAHHRREQLAATHPRLDAAAGEACRARRARRSTHPSGGWLAARWKRSMT